ncbi:acyltransferase family protein [Prosthecobacter fluviatilis]|uniref:Acyltransferase family protein n=1 Tax=Prosthecobacter fluviatilis TaxID=445931 RepID=A0ABW0KXI4_9BACT
MPPPLPSTELPPQHYRPDIDGLRALAVLPVILCHAGLGCPGGFVGVDVFFVISGYVITSLILREHAAGAFSLRRFWERRIRRIMPALTLVVSLVLAAGWRWYLPEDFIYMAKSVLAQTLMAANFFFWRGGIEYFEMSSDAQALLHTWSLAVEEQFYLVFPLLLTWLLRTRPTRWRRWLLGLAVVSLGLSVLATHSAPHFRAAFYLLPSRAWELLLGALLAGSGGRLSAGGPRRAVSGLAGLALIAWPVIAYTEHTRFPGLAALPPCLGAALIIASGAGGPTPVGRLLAWRPLVLIGLVSYPLYLWHWPLLALARYLHTQPAPLGVPVRLGLLLAAFGLAVLTWKCIETPLRQRRVLRSPRRLFLAAGLASALLFLLAALVYLRKGMPGRYPPRVLALSAARASRAFQEQVDLPRARAGRYIELGPYASSSSGVTPGGGGSTPAPGPGGSMPVRLLLWGDSHAKALAPALHTLCQQHRQRGLLSAYGGTAPVLGYVPPNLKSLHQDAPETARHIVAYAAAQRIPHIILAARWEVYPPTAEFKAALVSTVRTLQAGGARVYLVRDVPAPGFEVPRVVALRTLHGESLDTLGTTPAQHLRAEAPLQSTFDEIARMGATLLDPAPAFLTPHGTCRVVQGEKVLYFDTNHLTVEGAALLTPLFQPLFQE